MREREREIGKGGLKNLGRREIERERTYRLFCLKTNVSHPFIEATLIRNFLKCNIKNQHHYHRKYPKVSTKKKWRITER